MWKPVDGVDDARGDYSEDLAGAAGNMAWVLDGASVVSQERVTDSTDDPSDARWLVRHLDAELEALSDRMDPLEKLVALAIERTAAQAEVEWRGEPDVPPSAALGVVRHSGDRCEFFVLADVSVIMLTDAGAFEFIDQRVDKHTNGASKVMANALASGKDFKAASDLTRPYLAKHRRLKMNQNDGYWVASIHESAVAHALTGSIDGVHEIVLASDGFMRALRLFRLIPDLEALFAPDCNFRILADRIREKEREDPDTREHPRWSVSDDICARKLRWVGRQ